MAKLNYSFEKRQRELAKRKKKEGKRLKKADAKNMQSQDTDASTDNDIHTHISDDQ